MRNEITAAHSKAAIAHFIGHAIMYAQASHSISESFNIDQVKYFATLAWMSHKTGMRHQINNNPALAMSAFAVRDMHMKKARSFKNEQE